MLLSLLVLFPRLGYAAEENVAPAAIRESAVMRARSGDSNGALIILKNLVSKYPTDSRLLADTTVVANWAGDDSYALEVYVRPETPKDEVGVVEAAARSARNLHRFDMAIELFIRAEKRAPGRWQDHLGHAMVLVDLGRYGEAAALMKSLLQNEGLEPDVERGQAYLCSRQRDYACAITMYQKLIAQHPLDASALYCEMARTISDLGGNTLAQGVCRSTGTPEEMSIIAAAAAERVRWSESNDYDWQERKAEGEQALAMLDQVIGASKPSESIWKQAQADRIVSLSSLRRVREVVQSWEKLRSLGVELPDYALSRVADAYLALHQPELAETLYRNLLERSPRDGNLWLGLAYSQFESERIPQAFNTIDRAFRNAPAWLQSENLSTPQPNPSHVSLGIPAAQMRGFADMPEAEQKMLERLLALAPANSDLGRAMAMTYKARGWPMRAIMQESQADSYDQKADLPVLEDAEIYESAGRHKQADEVLNSVLHREGNSPAVTKFLMDRSVERGWQSTLATGYESSSGQYLGNVLHSEGYLYSPLIGYRWRAYTHGIGQLGKFNSGSTSRTRVAGGFSYDYDRQTFWGEVGTDSTDPGWTLTGAAGAQFRLGDQWFIRADGDWDNVTDVQLIAQLADVHARSGSASLEWRQNELRSAEVSFRRLLFSDGNQRSVLATWWEQRALTRPRLQLTIRPQLWVSENSKDQARVYFNPSRDGSLGLSSGVNWITWRRYDHQFLQQFKLDASPYWQEHYGFMGAYSADYTQRWTVTRRLSFFGRIVWNSHPYDGKREPYNDFSFGLTWGEQ